MKRRKIFTIIPDDEKKRLQLKYARILVISQMIGLLLVILSFSLIFTVCMYNATSASGTCAFGKAKIVTIVLFCLMTAFSIFLTWIFSIRISHRVLGPLFRIEKIMETVLETGQIPTIHIRKDDELQRTVFLLNQVLEKYKNKNSSGNEVYEDLKD